MTVYILFESLRWRSAEVNPRDSRDGSPGPGMTSGKLVEVGDAATIHLVRKRQRTIALEIEDKLVEKTIIPGEKYF